MLHGVLGGPKRKKPVKPFFRRVNQEIIIEEEILSEAPEPEEIILEKEIKEDSVLKDTSKTKIEIRKDKSKKKRRKQKINFTEVFQPEK